MRKKFTALQKDIEDQKDEIQSLFDDKKALHEHIASLEKDIQGLKKEIRERDETIGDKEKRIYDLKKKNQELEKFKFVLDYKIKELKKQIEPREVEIADMKETIQKMDHELERYHKNNAKLDLTIQDLRDKLVGLQKDVMKQRKAISYRDGAIQSFQSDLHETSRLIQNPQAARGVGEEPVPETRHDRGGGQDPGRGYPEGVQPAARVFGKVHREPQAQAAQGHGDAPLGQHAHHERKRQSAEGNQRAPPRDEAGASARARRRLGGALPTQHPRRRFRRLPAREAGALRETSNPRVRTSTSARTPRARLICSATSSRSFDWITS